MEPSPAGRRDGSVHGIAQGLRIITPLPELLAAEEQRVRARELACQARLMPALGRLRELVAFIGEGRAAAQASKLKLSDAVAVAQRLGVPGEPPAGARSIEVLPEVAHAFHLAIAARFIVRRKTRIVAGPCAGELEHDPLAAWTRAAIVRIAYAVLDGFRLGWRKTCVELLDADAPFLLALTRDAGGSLALSVIEDRVWPQLAARYGYPRYDDRERDHVAWLLRAMVAELPTSARPSSTKMRSFSPIWETCSRRSPRLSWCSAATTRRSAIDILARAARVSAEKPLLIALVSVRLT
jgi:hypothetical protein